MILTLEMRQLQAFGQDKAFLDRSATLTLAVPERPAACVRMAGTLRRFDYEHLRCRNPCLLLL
jgi:hypothetical protein